MQYNYYHNKADTSALDAAYLAHETDPTGSIWLRIQFRCRTDAYVCTKALASTLCFGDFVKVLGDRSEDCGRVVGVISDEEVLGCAAWALRGRLPRAPVVRKATDAEILSATTIVQQYCDRVATTIREIAVAPIEPVAAHHEPPARRAARECMSRHQLIDVDAHHDLKCIAVLFSGTTSMNFMPLVQWLSQQLGRTARIWVRVVPLDDKLGMLEYHPDSFRVPRSHCVHWGAPVFVLQPQQIQQQQQLQNNAASSTAASMSVQTRLPTFEEHMAHEQQQEQQREQQKQLQEVDRHEKQKAQTNGNGGQDQRNTVQEAQRKNSSSSSAATAVNNIPSRDQQPPPPPPPQHQQQQQPRVATRRGRSPTTSFDSSDSENDLKTTNSRFELMNIDNLASPLMFPPPFRVVNGSRPVPYTLRDHFDLFRPREELRTMFQPPPQPQQQHQQQPAPSPASSTTATAAAVVPPVVPSAVEEQRQPRRLPSSSRRRSVSADAGHRQHHPHQHQRPARQHDRHGDQRHPHDHFHHRHDDYQLRRHSGGDRREIGGREEEWVAPLPPQQQRSTISPRRSASNRYFDSADDSHRDNNSSSNRQHHHRHAPPRNVAASGGFRDEYWEQQQPPPPPSSTRQHVAPPPMLPPPPPPQQRNSSDTNNTVDMDLLPSFRDAHFDQGFDRHEDDGDEGGIVSTSQPLDTRDDYFDRL